MPMNSIYSYLIFFIFLYLPIFGCSQKPTNDSMFIQYLDRGYARKVKAYNYEPLIFGFLTNRKSTCIYGELPNETIKNNINSLYQLIVDELGELELPIYSSSLSKCPNDTSIFVFTHSTLNHPNKRLSSELKKVYEFTHAPITQKIKGHWPRFNGLGSSSIVRGTNGKIFVEFNQFDNLIKQDSIYIKLAKSIAIEELYQGITNGYDIPYSKKIMGKLHEASLEGNTIRQKEPSIFSVTTIGNNQYKTYFKDYLLDLKPKGLCSFDLWFLLLSDTMKDNKSYKYDDYVNMWKVNLKKYKEISSNIEVDKDYKHLFDSRCSGANAGINTKILAK